jgi:hypothetical protein
MNNEFLNAYCRFKYNEEEEKGKIFIYFDTNNSKRFKFQAIFDDIRSNNTLGYVATCVAMKYILLTKCKGTIYMPSILVVKQTKGEFKMETVGFKPFYDFIRKNISEDLSITFMKSKNIKISPREIHMTFNEDVISFVKSLIKESNQLVKGQYPRTIKW